MDTLSGCASVRIAPPCAHVRVSGDLDIATTPSLAVRLTHAAAAGCRDFRVDLSDVSFCDATAIGVLVGVDRRARLRGGSLIVVAASDRVRRVLDLVDLGRLLTPESGAPEPAATPAPA